MFSNAGDTTRLGALFLCNGRRAGRLSVAEKWIELARTPGPANPADTFANREFYCERDTLLMAAAAAVTARAEGEIIINRDREHDSWDWPLNEAKGVVEQSWRTRGVRCGGRCSSEHSATKRPAYSV
jgi:CubicO group peptidase (beta-lactamase class C family)